MKEEDLLTIRRRVEPPEFLQNDIRVSTREEGRKRETNEVRVSVGLEVVDQLAPRVLGDRQVFLEEACRAETDDESFGTTWRNAFWMSDGRGVRAGCRAVEMRLGESFAEVAVGGRKC